MEMLHLIDNKLITLLRMLKWNGGPLAFFVQETRTPTQNVSKPLGPFTLPGLLTSEHL